MITSQSIDFPCFDGIARAGRAGFNVDVHKVFYEQQRSEWMRIFKVLTPNLNHGYYLQYENSISGQPLSNRIKYVLKKPDPNNVYDWGISGLDSYGSINPSQLWDGQNIYSTGTIKNDPSTNLVWTWYKGEFINYLNVNEYPTSPYFRDCGNIELDLRSIGFGIDGHKQLEIMARDLAVRKAYTSNKRVYVDIRIRGVFEGQRYIEITKFKDPELENFTHKSGEKFYRNINDYETISKENCFVIDNKHWIQDWDGINYFRQGDYWFTRSRYDVIRYSPFKAPRNTIILTVFNMPIIINSQPDCNEDSPVKAWDYKFKAIFNTEITYEFVAFKYMTGGTDPVIFANEENITCPGYENLVVDKSQWIEILISPIKVVDFDTDIEYGIVY